MDILSKPSIPAGVQGLHGVDLTWPSSNAYGLMRNNGFGFISWENVPAGYTDWSGFLTRNTVAQSCANGTFTQVTFQTELYDHLNEVASSTFTPTVAGTYVFSAGIIFSSTVANTRVILSIYKNGSEFIHRLADVTFSSGGDVGVSGAMVLDLAAGDSMGLAMYQSSPSNISQSIFGSYAGWHGARIH